MRRPENERCEKQRANPFADWWKCFVAALLFAGLVLAGSGPAAFAGTLTPGDILLVDLEVDKKNDLRAVAPNRAR